MTEVDKKYIIITIALILVLVLIASRLYVQTLSAKDTVVKDNNANIQELLARQDQLLAMVASINSTIQTEVKKQNNLSNQIASLGGNSVVGSTGSGSSNTASSTTAPAPTPTPSRTTRAS